MTLKELIARTKKERADLEAKTDGLKAQLETRRAACQTARTSLAQDPDAIVIQSEIRRAEFQALEFDRVIDGLEQEQREDDRMDALSRESHPTEAGIRLAARDRGEEWSRQPDDASTAARADSGPRWIRTVDERTATVARGQRFAEQEIVAEHAARSSQREAPVIGQHGSLGQLVRAMTTTSGSALVPTVWEGDLIDRARNKAAVLKAGAEIIPMDAKTVQIGRLTGDPTSAFRTEDSTITASDPTFDNVTLTATTMSALVVGALEWFQDADNVDEIVSDAIAAGFALQLDLTGLYGSITTGAGSINLPTPPNPRGVLGTLNASAASSVLGAATNGTAQTTGSYYNELLDLIYTPRSFNEEPTALIYNSKLGLQYAKAYDTTGQPLAAPEDVKDMPRHISNQVPSYTQGTMTSRATDVFAGDWSQLLIGQRLGLTIQTLTERYAENGQIGIVAHWRGDVALARPRAFAVYKALQGAA